MREQTLQGALYVRMDLFAQKALLNQLLGRTVVPWEVGVQQGLLLSALQDTMVYANEQPPSLMVVLFAQRAMTALQVLLTSSFIHAREDIGVGQLWTSLLLKLLALLVFTMILCMARALPTANFALQVGNVELDRWITE